MVPECHFPPTVSQSPRQVEVPEGSGETGPQEGRHRLRALSSCACIKITREPAHKGNPRDGGLRPHGERPQEGPNPCRVCHVGELSGPRWASVSSWAKGPGLLATSQAARKQNPKHGGQGRGLQRSGGQGWCPPPFRVRWGQICRVPAPWMGPSSSLSAPPWGQCLLIWG